MRTIFLSSSQNPCIIHIWFVSEFASVTRTVISDYYYLLLGFYHVWIAHTYFFIRTSLGVFKQDTKYLYIHIVHREYCFFHVTFFYPHLLSLPTSEVSCFWTHCSWFLQEICTSKKIKNHTEINHIVSHTKLGILSYNLSSSIEVWIAEIFAKENVLFHTTLFIFMQRVCEMFDVRQWYRVLF